MKKIVLVLVIICAMSPLRANAFDWMSALKFWERATEAQTVEVQQTKTLADIENQMAAIDKSVQDAFVNIVSELSSRKDTNNIKSQLKASNANLANIISNYTNTIANKKEDFTKTVKKLSSKEKTTLINNLSVLSEDAQQYMLLATEGAKTATTALKSAQKLSEVATTMGNINRVAVELKTRAATVIDMTNQIKSIATAAGVSVK